MNGKSARSLAFAVIATLVSASCSKPAPLTGDAALDALRAGGVPVADIQRPARDARSPLPNSYRERVTFALPDVAPKGGQLFLCDTREYCDAIFAYFDALKALAGPYLYRSKDGLLVVQMNSGLAPDAAEKARAVVESLP